MTELRGARALVTGASGGLGRAVAVALAERGCLVVVSGRRPEPLQAVAALVGGRAVPADLSQAGEVAGCWTRPGSSTSWWPTPPSPGAETWRNWIRPR